MLLSASSQATIWLILTSANAVHALVERAAAFGNIRQSTLAWHEGGLAVGASDGLAEARKTGSFKVAFIPQAYVAESLVEGLLANAPKQAIRPANSAGAGCRCP